MLKKAITYTNFDGEKVTEEYNFNLNKAELIKLNMGVKGGLENAMKKAITEEDTTTVIDIIEKILLTSYGVKSEDGKHFVKTKELIENFKYSEAYSELFVELLSEPDSINEFILNVVPAETRSAVAKELEKLSTKSDSEINIEYIEE